MDNQITADELRENIIKEHEVVPCDRALENYIFPIKRLVILNKAACAHLATLDAQPTPEPIDQRTAYAEGYNEGVQRDREAGVYADTVAEPITEGDWQKYAETLVQQLNDPTDSYATDIRVMAKFADEAFRATKTNDVNDINVADMPQAVDKQKNTTGITDWDKIEIAKAICAYIQEHGDTIIARRHYDDVYDGCMAVLSATQKPDNLTPLDRYHTGEK